MKGRLRLVGQKEEAKHWAGVLLRVPQNGSYTHNDNKTEGEMEELKQVFLSPYSISVAEEGSFTSENSHFTPWRR